MNPKQLLDDLNDFFNDAELRQLCFQLNVNYEDLGGTGRSGKALELVTYLERRGRLPELAQWMVAQRPNLAAKYPVQNIPLLPPDPVLPQPDPPDPSLVADPLPPIPSTLQNPYNAGPMVVDKTMFFGREEQRRSLHARLQNMGSASIVGMRRVGKSSLLHYLTHYEHFSEALYLLFAYVDLQDAEYHTLPGLLNGVLTQWMGKIGRPSQPIMDSAGFSRQVRALRHEGWRPVLCLDEFEQLTSRPQEFTDTLFEAWRALGNDSQLAFVTASHASLNDLIRQQGWTSNFDNIFTQTDLGLLTEAEARELLTVPLARQGVMIPAADVDQLLAWAGPHPFYLQMAAFHYVQTLGAGEDGRSRAQIHFEQDAERHWKGLWKALSGEEQAALRAAVGQARPGPAIELQRRSLLRKGVMRKEGDTWRPFSQGFAAFVAIAPLETPDEPIKPIPKPQPDNPTPAPTPPQPRVLPPILLYTLVFLLILLVVALVLRFIFNQQDFLSLSILVAVGLTFALVGAEQITGKEFLSLLRDFIGKK